MILSWAQFNFPHYIELVIYYLLVFTLTQKFWFNRSWKLVLHFVLLPIILNHLNMTSMDTLLLTIWIILGLKVLVIDPAKQLNKKTT